MKQCTATCCLVFLLIQILFSQDERLNQVNRMQRTGQIAGRFLAQRKDTARIDLYKLFSAYFIDHNIYPNPDVIDLVDAYNKEFTFIDIKANPKQFKEIQLPAVSFQLRLKLNNQRFNSVRKSRVPGDDFNKAFSVFIQKRDMVYAAPGYILSFAFKDSLNLFGKDVLPRISANSFKITKLQMEFFLLSLLEINKFMNGLANPAGNDPLVVMTAIKELMDDFYVFLANLDGNDKVKGRDVFIQPTSLFHYAVNESQLDQPEQGAELPNANIYVYTKGPDGKWSQAPKPNSFNVYYGPNGLKYSLKPGCDTLSFFRYHPSVPASTLPVILAKGNYCFVLQDINTGRIYLKPGINLRDNKVVDTDRLIKLCFKVEN